VVQFVKRTGGSLDELIERRVAFLTDYQSARYAARYRAFVARVREAETGLATVPASRLPLTEAVAKYLFKLMAYKDEYEVARLHTDTGFLDKIAAQFEGDYRVLHHLAPPLLAKKDSQGHLVKRPYGPWMRTAFRWLARFKPLRGTWFDPFGFTRERRGERALIVAYRASIDELLGTLTPARLPLALQIARIPEDIRGYGHVKARHLVAAKGRWDTLMHAWRGEPDKDQPDAVQAA
jgi:indolepyruvate ferredoxin oxidoreductase